MSGRVFLNGYCHVALPYLDASSKRQSSAFLHFTAGLRLIPVSGLKGFKTECVLTRLYDWISVTLFPKKRHVSLTPTGKSAFLTHFQRQVRPCSLSVRIKEQRLAPRPRKATKKRRFLLPDVPLSTRCCTNLSLA